MFSLNLTGLVQLPGEIVVRFAHMIYPCSLNGVTNAEEHQNILYSRVCSILIPPNRKDLIMQYKKVNPFCEL